MSRFTSQESVAPLGKSHTCSGDAAAALGVKNSPQSSRQSPLSIPRGGPSSSDRTPKQTCESTQRRVAKQ